MAEDERGAAPPYVSFTTFLSLLDRLKEGGIPQRIDRSYWGGFLAGGYGAQVMTALRYLDLLKDNNEPTPKLDDLVNGERKAVLATLLRERYAPIFSAVDLARVTPGHLDEEFRKSYGISGQTARKVVGFFVQAAQYAGIEVSKHVSDRMRTRTTTRKPGTRTASRRPKDGNDIPPKQQEPALPAERGGESDGRTRTVQLRSGGRLTLSYSVDLFDLDRADRDFVFGLIDQLREYGQNPAKEEAVQPAE
jgi:hypothetical protein